MNAHTTVFVVDDDAAVRDALKRLLESADYDVETYPDAETFLAAHRPQRAGCLLLDMNMPGMSGLELQAVLVERKDRRPIIFLTAHGTVPTTAKAFKGGAFEFLEKPAEGAALLTQVYKALQWDADYRREEEEADKARALFATLTEREREILPLLVAGTSNKDIARKLDISHRTVELHRMHILHKVGVHSIVELVVIATVLGLPPPR